MEPNTTLRLDKLALENFRCFAGCSLELHPTLTVLIAENAQGKTALLKAISIALQSFVTAIGKSTNYTGFTFDDIRQVRRENEVALASHVKFKAEGYVDGVVASWSRSLASYSVRARNTKKDAKTIEASARHLGERLAKATKDNPVVLPVIAFYGTGRLWDERRLTDEKRWLASANPVRFSAYFDCLSPSSSFQTFAAWYEATANALRNPTSRAFGPDEKPESQLAAVRKAVGTVLEPTGWTKIDWQFPGLDEDGVEQGTGYLVVEHENRGRLPLSWLSDGVRNMVALVGDLAHRCVRLNPQLGEDAAKLTPGILLIDEVDMHLHPRWQQLVVGLLQTAFPAMQMVFTTHSPQVISTVHSSSVRVVRLLDGNCVPETPSFQTRGVESAEVLARIMDVDPVPYVEEAQWLSEYRAKVQQGDHDTAEGRSLWDKLTAHFGADHPVLVEIETLRRLQDFKKQNRVNLPLHALS